jgi:hypothetical protein
MDDTLTPHAEEPAGPAGWTELLNRRLAEVSQSEALLTPRLQAAVLRLARDVAHGSERKNAPLAAFIAGRYVEHRLRQNIDAEAALAEVIDAAAALLSETPATS